MTIADTISSIRTHLQDAWDAVHAKGGTSAGDDNLENLAAAIEALSGGAGIDFTAHPDAYVGMLGLSAGGDSGVEYITDEADARAVLAGTYAFNQLPLSLILKVAFSPKANELGVTSIGNDFLRFAGPGESEWNRPALNLMSVEGLEHLTTVTSIGDGFLKSSSGGMDRSPIALQHLSGLPPNLTSIGDTFLSGQSQYNEPINIPDTVTSIGNNFLSNMAKFNSPIHFPESLTTYDTQNGLLMYMNSFNQPIVLPANMPTIPGIQGLSSFNSEITLPVNPTAVENNFLAQCPAFDQPVTLPDSVVTIGTSFLANNSSFNQPVVLSTNLQTIGNSFMYGALSFNQPLTFPDSLQSIANDALYDCQSFASVIHIPENVSWGSNSFFSTLLANVPYYAGILVEGTDTAIAQFKAAYPNSTGYPARRVITSEDERAYGGYWTPSTLYTIITDPSVIEQICNGTFTFPSNASGLTFTPKAGTISSITTLNNFLKNAPNGLTPNGLQFLTQVTTIGDYYLQDVKMDNNILGPLMPPNVTAVGGYAFFGTSLGLGNYRSEGIALPDGITTIGDSFMSSASNISANIHLPANLKTLGANAFSVDLNDKNNSYMSLELPEGLESIGNQFMSSYSKTSEYWGPRTVTIPSTVTSIGNGFLSDVYGSRIRFQINTTAIPADQPMSAGNYIRSISSTTESAPAYVDGIRLSGPGAETWAEALPNWNGEAPANIYRNIIVDN